jgi:hypothetical protein
MKLEDKVNQLTDLLADLIPTVDKLGKTVNETQETNRKTHIELSEMRLSNLKLAEAIEKLVVKIDKLSDFEYRLERLEKQVFK